MTKARSKWPDHPLVGRSVGYTKDGKSRSAEVVDVKSGPMMIDTSTFDRPTAKIFGTLKLRLKDSETGAEFWSSPLKWSGKSTKTKKAGAAGEVVPGCEA